MHIHQGICSNRRSRKQSCAAQYAGHWLLTARMSRPLCSKSLACGSLLVSSMSRAISWHTSPRSAWSGPCTRTALFSMHALACTVTVVSYVLLVLLLAIGAPGCLLNQHIDSCTYHIGLQGLLLSQTHRQQCHQTPVMVPSYAQETRQTRQMTGLTISITCCHL